MTADGGLHVLSLSAKDYLALECVEIELGPDGLIVSGGNGNGKSAILSILGACLGGKAMEPECPVKVGHHRAEIACVLGRDGVTKYKVEKVFESGRATKLVVTLADGTRAAKPQAILDGLVDALSFDPSAFVSPPGARTPDAAAKVQFEMLMRASPPLNADGTAFDLAENRRVHASKYAERTDVTRERKRLEVVMTSTVKQPVPEAVDVSAKSAALTEANATAAKVAEAKRRLVEMDATIADRESLILRYQQEIAGIRERREKVAPWAALTPPDVAALQSEIAAAAETNTRRAQALTANASLAATVQLLADERKKERGLDDAIEILDRLKHEALERAAFPVKGLSVDGERVVMQIEGGTVPFAQLNLSTKYVVAFHVLAKLHPEFRTCVVRDGNSFDPDHLGALFGVARSLGFQLIVERVAADSTPRVEIEAGAVARRVD